MAVVPINIQPQAVEIQDERIQVLRDAVECRNIKALWAALASGVDPNADFYEGFTALHATAYQGTAEMARLLIQAGAKVNQQNEAGNTPLHLCILNKSRGIFVAEFLIWRKADLSIKNGAEQTPLDLAEVWAKTRRDYPERAMVRLLKKHSS